MQVTRAETLEGRAATLRSAQSPRPMAAVAVVLALLAQVVSVDAEAASVQRNNCQYIGRIWWW